MLDPLVLAIAIEEHLELIKPVNNLVIVSNIFLAPLVNCCNDVLEVVGEVSFPRKRLLNSVLLVLNSCIDIIDPFTILLPEFLVVSELFNNVIGLIEIWIGAFDQLAVVKLSGDHVTHFLSVKHSNPMPLIVLVKPVPLLLVRQVDARTLLLSIFKVPEEDFLGILNKA